MLKALTAYPLAILLPCLLSAHCKTVDSLYLHNNPRGADHRIQISEYAGHLYLQEDFHYLRQLKSQGQLGDLQADAKPDGDDIERPNRREHAVSVTFSDNRKRATVRFNDDSVLTFEREHHPALSSVFAQLRKGITFSATRPDYGRKKSLTKFRMEGPFLQVAEDAARCERFAYVVGTGGDFTPAGKKHDQIGFRAAAARHSELGLCGATLEDGRRYSTADNAFGGIFVLDDEHRIVGVLVLAYMYAEFFLAEGYPAEKAGQWMRGHVGTAESAFE